MIYAIALAIVGTAWRFLQGYELVEKCEPGKHSSFASFAALQLQRMKRLTAVLRASNQETTASLASLAISEFFKDMTPGRNSGWGGPWQSHPIIRDREVQRKLQELLRDVCNV